MLISEYVKLNWNSRNKNRYVHLGYKFTKMGESFLVKIEDLSQGSDSYVEVQCDYCGRIYQKHWHNYISENQKSEIHTDCCCNCKKYKIIETTEKKYGVQSVLSLDYIKEKVAKTNYEKYGVKNPFQSEEIKEKIKNTNLRKYGTKSPLQNKLIIKKMSETCMERYGVPYYVCTKHFSGSQHPKWKGGVSYHRVERSTLEYINWRNQVFQKDSYICQCCGERNGNGYTVKLNAHHIKNWKDNSDIRYDINNGVTLCEKCHLLFHKTFGKKNNDELQLRTFFNNYDKKLC